MKGMRRLLLIIAIAAIGVQVAPGSESSVYASDETYSTRGVVKGFGPERKTVNIAHEKIDGYMEAMMMSFEPRSPKQLDGLAAGDTVKLSFTATSDGHRYLSSIEKVR